jgi:FkbM family methyltransferase
VNLLTRTIERVRYQAWAPWRVNRYPFFNLSHAQAGEDMVVRRLLQDRPVGTYVDIGAYHPVLLSNTYYFYQLGWRGLNVDVRPSVIELCDVLRPRDTNVVAAVSDCDGRDVTVYEFDPAALTTLSADTAALYQRRGNGRLVREFSTHTVTINQLLERHGMGPGIDLLSVDVEGLDEVVLRSLDWTRFRPSVVCFELNDVPFEHVAEAPLVAFVRAQGYTLSARVDQAVVMVAA